MTYAYQTTIHWCNQSQAFVATVPELPGCTARGSSLNEALVNAHQAMCTWLDAARNSGAPIPEPMSGQTASPVTYSAESATANQKQGWR
jgi:predicted RNase H-like HicB family nuclease